MSGSQSIEDLHESWEGGTEQFRTDTEDVVVCTRTVQGLQCSVQRFAGIFKLRRTE